MEYFLKKCTGNEMISKNTSKWKRLLQRLKLRECILWLIFLAVVSVSCRAVSPALKSAFFSNGAAWHWNFFLFSMMFSCGYFVFLLISALFAPKWHEVYTSETLPECTVLVPAYNEGKHVFDTLTALLASDYPPEKLHITAINDGSQDDTYFWIMQAQQRSPRISVIDLKKNMGKKYALYQGMINAEGDIIVTVDSDSIVRRDTLRQLVQPFADIRIGAVAGSITAKHRERNWHVRLLDVMLIFGCDFLRRAQSSSGNVFCAPGALSGYRKSAVLPVAPIWLEQTFMGKPAHIGEDRAIATLLLRHNHRVVYQPQAKAETCLPTNYRSVCRMLLRWTRSDIRENILMIPFVWKWILKPAPRSLILFIHWIALFINMLLPLIYIPAGLYGLLITKNMGTYLAFFCAASALWSIIPATIYICKKHSFRQTIWAFMFGFYVMLALSWINIYSVFTINNSNWLTRNLTPAGKT